MASKEREEFRIMLRQYRAERRNEHIERLRSDFRAVAKDAKMESERLISSTENALSFISIPPDYRKLLDAFGICSPKTRRLADLTLDIFDRMDSRVFMRILKDIFFEENTLKPKEFHTLFADFHSALLEEIRTMKEEDRYIIPLYKVEIAQRRRKT